MSVNLKGNILVTGTNRGIGLELVKQLAEKTGPETQIYASCRDPEGTRAEKNNMTVVMSQAALNMLTCCQAEDFRRHGILVTAIHPGWVQTEMGGEQAPLMPQDSVAGMLHVMSTLSNKHSGLLLDWEGNTIPW
ncbi:uncharacterized protein LOC114153418 [Xiphophorus couchianus]|uniref:uncharacterized protein LOC114153418 n=1 Tax=Xiphophorus couchianus TaxID=32473 RepID=UPI001016302A|nr:uncharacterized protein LOC114153418 [Xiphophorus couchianus]